VSPLAEYPAPFVVTSYLTMGSFDPPGTQLTYTRLPSRACLIRVIVGAPGTSDGTPNTGSEPRPVDPSVYFVYTTNEYWVPLLKPVNAQEVVFAFCEQSDPEDDVTR
jgi:hypothetical protein